MKVWIKENRFMAAAIVVLLIYLAPNIFFPGSARYVIHDNLDSNVVWYKNLAESGKMFASNTEMVSRAMGGIERGCYPSEFNFQHLLYLFFSPLTAYTINSLVMHFLALFSMYIFTRKYVLKEESYKWVAVSVSLLFALLPFWPSGGAAVTAQPLLLYAFLNIYNKELNWKNWLIIIAIPFYSVLAFTNMFFVFILFFFFAVLCIYKKNINLYVILAFAIFVIASVLAEYRLFQMQFIEHYESHRSVLPNIGTLNFKGLIGVSFLHFMKGHHHFLCLQFPFIILTAGLAIILAKAKKERLLLISLLLLTYVLSMLFVLPDWKGLDGAMNKLTFLKSFTLRFYSLFPLLWFIILAYSSYLIVQYGKLISRIIPLAFIGMIITTMLSVFDKDYFGSGYAENTFYNSIINRNKEGFASFDEYYKPDLFDQVKEELKPGDYKICCIGLQPEIAQYNGFNTIDGYFYYYSRKHNELMKRIAIGEMEKLGEKTLGNRCYLRSSEREKGAEVIKQLSLDYELLKENGTRYLFSDCRIIDEHLAGEKAYDKNGYKLYVYSIN